MTEDEKATDSSEDVQPGPGRGMMTIKAVVKRADGTIEDLGVVSEGPIRMEAK